MVRLPITISRPDMSTRLGVTVTTPAPNEPIVVTTLTDGMLAVESGLRLDDVVLTVNGVTPDSPNHCTELFKLSKDLSLLVERTAVGDSSAATPRGAARLAAVSPAAESLLESSLVSSENTSTKKRKKSIKGTAGQQRNVLLAQSSLRERLVCYPP